MAQTKNTKKIKTSEMKVTRRYQLEEGPRLSIAQQLKEARKNQGMTQQELAEAIGTKKSNISRLESGRYNPSLDFLIKVADGLGKHIAVSVQ